ncbi:MAG: hypothetical protein M3P23_06720 [Actinomycetota bacterium]|nr:hypothetical protein [Actinomycetota bacterium]
MAGDVRRSDLGPGRVNENLDADVWVRRRAEVADLGEVNTKEELLALVATVDAVDRDVLYNWLAGPEVTSPAPSPE